MLEKSVKVYEDSMYCIINDGSFAYNDRITKYAQNDRSSQEKIVHEHEAETNASSSPRTRSHQQGERYGDSLA